MTIAKETDEALLQAYLRKRDKDAYGQLYERHFPSLSKYIAWQVHDLEKGKDLAQNIFLKLYQNPNSFDTSRNFKVWLYTVAKNRWKNELRNEAIRTKHRALVPVETETFLPEQTEKDERLKNLDQALGSLSENHKEVFILKYSNGLSIKEIAEVCACSEGTVKSRLFYALKYLKTELNHSKINEL